MQIHQLKGYIQTIYLIEYDSGLMLLDGGCRADVALVVNEITQNLNRPLSDLKIIVVTHMHPDHAGAAQRLRAMSGCRIIAAKSDRHWYRGVDGLLMYLSDIWLARWMAKKKQQPKSFLYFWPWLKPDFQLDDEASIPGFEDWCVLETPGHTDRDLSVMHKPSQRIYVADLMVRVKGHYIPPFPLFYPNRYRRSVERIAALEPSSLWLAHGPEIEFNAAEQEHLLKNAPVTPITHWRSVKIKFRQAFGLSKS